MSLPSLSVRRPVTMSMICAVVILLGAVALVRLPVDLMPDVSFPSLTVSVSYPDVGPLEIEELITRPIEQAVSAVSGLEDISSTSSEGQSVTRLSFAWGTDLNEAADDLRSRLDRVRGRLPEQADPPVIFKFDSSATPIMFMGLEGDYDEMALRELAENDLAPRLERVPGVASVTVQGGIRRQVNVELAKERIIALDLAVGDIVNLLQTENQNVPIGELDDGDMSYLLRTPGQFTSVDDIRNIVVLMRAGVPIYLGDIAEVTDGTEDATALVRINGRPGVRVSVSKQSGKNTVAVARAVRAEVGRINREMPSLQFTIRNDSSRFIEQSIAAVRNVVLWGAVLVVVVLFAFLRNVRTTLIICTAIPISIIGTFALLYFGGYTLNTITFGGLALGVGMIVDASIVVLENTYRHMEAGKERRAASIEGAEEVTAAIIASSLTQVAVFLPLLFLTGIASIIYGQLAIVVMIALGMSLFVAVTLVPVLTSTLLRAPRPSEGSGPMQRLNAASERGLAGLDNLYRRLIHRALAHRPTVVLAATASVVIAALLLPTVGVELTPEVDEGEVQINAELPIGTRFERTIEVLVQLEEMARAAVPETVTITTQAGGGGGGPFGGGSSHRGSITLTLSPKDQRARTSDEIAQSLRRELNRLPGVAVRARASGGNRQMTRLTSRGGADSRFTLEIRGHDLADARQLARRAEAMMADTAGIADVQIGTQQSRPEMSVRVDRSKAALLGMRVSQIADSLRTGVAGTQAAFFRDRGNEYAIVVRLREQDRQRIEDIRDIPLSTPGGLVIPARNLIEIYPVDGPEQIERKNQERITRINAEIEATLSDAVEAVGVGIPTLDPPADFSIGFGAEVEEQARSFRELLTVLLLAILLVYAVMAAQFESLRDPFIIILSIPLAGIGVVAGLLLTDTPFSIQAYMGVILLGGLVVNNAILLVDYTNLLRRRDGLSLRAAVETAGRTRLRPILMTTVTTLLGMLPMALGIGEGSELQAPLARVVVGGLLTSTLVTLIVVPVVYTLLEEGLASLRHHPPTIELVADS